LPPFCFIHILYAWMTPFSTLKDIFISKK